MKQTEEVNPDMESNESSQENESNPVAESQEQQQNSSDEILKEANDKYLRLYSEFENYKRRISRDRMEQTKMAGSDILVAFLPVIDDLERALKAMEDHKDADAMIEGLKLIYSKVKNIMESKGLKPIDARGKKFDVELHDAIANVPSPDENSKGMVIDEIEKGYFLNDKVIRHSKVIVGN